MFKKLVIIEPINMLPMHIEKLKELTNEFIYYKDIPYSDEEKLKRIDDADCVLLSYTSSINAYVLENSKNLKYVGMCCSLYSKESANVDISKYNFRIICKRIK